MYAIVEVGGKQYKASEGDVLFIEKLDAEPKATVTFDQVLLVSADSSVTTGAPYIAGAKVEAVVEKNGKGKKIRVFKMKPKKGYRRRKGHRQPYTKVVVSKISV